MIKLLLLFSFINCANNVEGDISLNDLLQMHKLSFSEVNNRLIEKGFHYSGNNTALDTGHEWKKNINNYQYYISIGKDQDTDYVVKFSMSEDSQYWLRLKKSMDEYNAQLKCSFQDKSIFMDVAYEIYLGQKYAFNFSLGYDKSGDKTTTYDLTVSLKDTEGIKYLLSQCP